MRASDRSEVRTAQQLRRTRGGLYRQTNLQPGGPGMTTTNTVDAARVELLLNELRLPSIRLMGPSSPRNPTRKVGRRPASAVPHEHVAPAQLSHPWYVDLLGLLIIII